MSQLQDGDPFSSPAAMMPEIREDFNILIAWGHQVKRWLSERNVEKHHGKIIKTSRDDVLRNPISNI